MQDYKDSNYSPVTFPVTDAAVQEEVAALRRLLLKAQEAFAPWEAKEEALRAEANAIEELETRERARIQRGQGSRDKARELKQAANAAWKKIHGKGDGLVWETGYRYAKMDLDAAQRVQADFEELKAKWLALQAAHDAKIAAAAEAAAAAAAAEKARLDAWQKRYDAEIASRPAGWQSFRWNGKDYDGDRVDD